MISKWWKMYEVRKMGKHSQPGGLAELLFTRLTVCSAWHNPESLDQRPKTLFVDWNSAKISSLNINL